MNRYRLDEAEEASDLLAKFKVIVEFTVKADCEDDAIYKVSDVIKEGIEKMIEIDDGEEYIDDYSIEDSEPAELL